MSTTLDPRARFGDTDLPWVHREAYADQPAYRAAPPHWREVADRYHDDGYVIVEAAADVDLCRRLREALERRFDRTPRPERLLDAWTVVPEARQIAGLPEIVDLLAFLYERAPRPFQTLHFDSGTEQGAHADAIHFASLPPRFMCGVWVALEDVGPDQGPLFVHPGTHLGQEIGPPEMGRTLADFTYGEYVEATKARVAARPEPHRFLARAGDALIWASNVVHGGSPVFAPGSSRWSQVTHYFFDDAVYYTPMSSDLAAGTIFLRHPLRDVRTGGVLEHRWNGRPARFQRLPRRQARLLEPDERLSPLERVASAARGLTERSVRAARYLEPRLGQVAARADWARRFVDR